MLKESNISFEINRKDIISPYEIDIYTKLKEYLIEYLKSDDTPNEDKFRQVLHTKIKATNALNLFTWDFYTVVDFLCSLVKLYREI